MTFSLTSDEQFAPDELRTAFVDLVRKEINTREPAQAVKALYSDDPQQLEFNFVFSKTKSS